LQITDESRGVSLTVKLPVSKTGLGGSNPSAPASLQSRAGNGERWARARSNKKRAVTMGKSAAVTAMSEGSFTERMKFWPQRIKAFYSDVRTEMKKVTTPSRKEVQATTVVVIITVFLFGAYFWLVDNTIARIIDTVMRHFTHR
jgi:preprotein translocase subunit SecE